MISTAFLRQLVRVNQLRPGTRTLVVGRNSADISEKLYDLGIQADGMPGIAAELPDISQPYHAVIVSDSSILPNDLSSDEAWSISAGLLGHVDSGGSLGIVMCADSNTAQPTAKSLVAHLTAFESINSGDSSIRLQVVRRGVLFREAEAVLAALKTGSRRRTPEQWLQRVAANLAATSSVQRAA